jgi:hypothetical protein
LLWRQGGLPDGFRYLETIGADGTDLAKLLPENPRESKENQGNRAWILLDFLGFLRPIWGFSRGYEQSIEKSFGAPETFRFSGPFSLAVAKSKNIYAT